MQPPYNIEHFRAMLTKLAKVSVVEVILFIALFPCKRSTLQYELDIESEHIKFVLHHKDCPFLCCMVKSLGQLSVTKKKLEVRD